MQFKLKAKEQAIEASLSIEADGTLWLELETDSDNDQLLRMSPDGEVTVFEDTADQFGLTIRHA